jgi:beta-glucanase (GH16 family)
MRSTRALTCAALVVAVLAGCAAQPHDDTIVPIPSPTLGTIETAAPPEFAPLWKNEFTGPEGTAVDGTEWNTLIGNRATEGWGNNELQFYTAEAARLDGHGHLVITAAENLGENAADLPCWNDKPCAYTSARLTTEGNVELLYGRVEMRAKLPRGAGLWPALWMLGGSAEEWPAGGEIDIMEWIGATPSTVYGTAHGPGYSGDAGIGAETTLGPADDGFHVFAMEKRAGDIRWFVDGDEYFRMTPESIPAGTEWVFDRPFYLLLNLAVGGTWPGAPSESTVFPQQLIVDWIRVSGEGTAP